MGDLRPNFDRSEFRCPCCQHLGVLDSTLLDTLQRARERTGRPLAIVSGWRCSEWNRAVGGMLRSQHTEGRGADVPRGYLDVEGWIECGAIGVGVRNGQVIHVDTQPDRLPYVFQD